MTAPSALASRVHPALRYMIEPTASLEDDLQLHLVDLWGVRDDIEQETGRIIPEDEFSKWKTVAHVSASHEAGRKAA